MNIRPRERWIIGIVLVAVVVGLFLLFGID